MNGQIWFTPFQGNKSFSIWKSVLLKRKSPTFFFELLSNVKTIFCGPFRITELYVPKSKDLSTYLSNASEVPKTPFLSVGSNENALFGEAKLRADDVGNETLEKPFWLQALENPFKAKLGELERHLS